jgi:hypothetical protein
MTKLNELKAKIPHYLKSSTTMGYLKLRSQYLHAPQLPRSTSLQVIFWMTRSAKPSAK